MTKESQNFIKTVREDFKRNKQKYLKQAQSIYPEANIVDIKLIGSYRLGNTPTEDSDIDLGIVYANRNTDEYELVEKFKGEIFGYGGIFDIVPVFVNKKEKSLNEILNEINDNNLKHTKSN